MGWNSVKYPDKKESAIYMLGIGTGLLAPGFFFALLSAAANSELINSIVGNKASLLTGNKIADKNPSKIILFALVIAGVMVGIFKIAKIGKKFVLGFLVGLMLRVLLLGFGIDLPVTWNSPENAVNTTAPQNASNNTSLQTFS